MSRLFPITRCIVILFLFVSLSGCGPDESPGAPKSASTPTSPNEDSSSEVKDARYFAYRDALHRPPESWHRNHFELSHDYPELPAECSTDECGWLRIDPDFLSTDYEMGRWADYMSAILDYVKQGQTLTDNDGWFVDVDGETRWYHVPWMTFSGKSGREFIHGLTNERTAALSDLIGATHGLPGVAGNVGQFETWAFGVYNPWGAAAIGATWDDDGKPVMNSECKKPPWNDCLPAGLPFAEGTLVTKLLFTTATRSDAGYLENSPEWMANRHINLKSCERNPAPVHLVQMDVAVVDRRSPTGWVYGTFGYNGTIDSDDVWDRMSPIGVQWGADPGAFPAVADPAADTIAQTSMAAINIYEHDGCGGRLAGPVDNKLASCLSCHGSAYAHAPIRSETKIGKNVPPIYSFTDMCTKHNQNNIAYFSNRTLGETWEDYPDAVAMDTSLQMTVAFTGYGSFANGGTDVCPPSSQ